MLALVELDNEPVNWHPEIAWCETRSPDKPANTIAAMVLNGSDYGVQLNMDGCASVRAKPCRPGKSMVRFAPAVDGLKKLAHSKFALTATLGMTCGRRHCSLVVHILRDQLQLVSQASWSSANDEVFFKRGGVLQKTTSEGAPSQLWAPTSSDHCFISIPRRSTDRFADTRPRRGRCDVRQGEFANLARPVWGRSTPARSTAPACRGTAPSCGAPAIVDR